MIFCGEVHPPPSSCSIVTTVTFKFHNNQFWTRVRNLALGTPNIELDNTHLLHK